MRVYDRESQASFLKQVSDYDLLNGKKMIYVEIETPH